YSGFNFRKVDSDVSYYIYAPFVYKLFIKDTSLIRIAGLHGFILAIKLSDPVIWNINPIKFIKIHGLKSAIAYYYYKMLKNIELMSFTNIHIINPFMKNFLSEKLNYKTIYVPIWTNIKRVNKDEFNKFTILILGANNFTKGRDICEKIIYHLRANKDIQFISNININNPYVKNVGYIKEEKLAEILSRAHVLLYPARLDTFGLSIIEALNCGTPVVTSNILAHKIFNYPVILSSTIYEYVKNLRMLYYIWKSGSYHEIRKKAILEGRKYCKDNVFPKYRKIFKC
ncbi:MAG: glycosyltransferase, partial [Candidatus Methanomethylicaceae archaeon]